MSVDFNVYVLRQQAGRQKILEQIRVVNGSHSQSLICDNFLMRSVLYMITES
jgi:hypothetical protein